jgi:hypothetical protein
MERIGEEEEERGRRGKRGRGRWEKRSEVNPSHSVSNDF